MPTNSARSLIGLIGLCLCGWLAGCGSGVNPIPPPKGVLWLSWTIRGQRVSDAVCADLDHLVITVESTPSVGVAIEPVLCARGADWERDDVVEGSDTVLLDAVDASEQARFEGRAAVGVSEAKPAAPTVVDLQPL